jgi:hypothetical protein
MDCVSLSQNLSLSIYGAKNVNEHEATHTICIQCGCKCTKGSRFKQSH